jgi:hypothetical protein
MTSHLTKICQNLAYLAFISNFLLFSQPIKAQDLSNEQISLYAQTLMEIETHRQQAYQQIQTIMGEEPPEIICNQPQTYNGLPEDAQKVAITYCQTSETLVQDRGMSVQEFNDITLKIREDKNLERRVQQVMLNLQDH